MTKSKKSCSNFSFALFAENIKRFWPILAVGSLLYFISGPYLLILRIGRDRGEYFGHFVSEMLKNMNFGFMLGHLLLPVAAAVMVFKYLQDVPSAGVIHSMPFSRRKLYITNFSSGLFLSWAPILFTGLVLFLLKRPVFVEVGGGLPAVDVFTFQAIAVWILESLVMVAFVYAIAVFSGIVTGHAVLHTLGSYGFNFMVPAIYGVSLAYSERFLFGFSMSSTFWDIASNFTPVLGAFSRALGGYSSGETVGTGILSRLHIYISVMIIVALVSYFLYTKRPLERAGDSLVFRFMQHYVAFLFVFFLSSMFGLWLHYDGYGYTGFVLGGLLGFLVGEMVVKKTFKIFNMEGFKSLAVYAVLMALFIVSFQVDAFGYERRIPAAGNIKSVEVYSSGIDGYGGYGYNRRSTIAFEDAENIESVRRFHEHVVANRAEYRRWNENESGRTDGYGYIDIMNDTYITVNYVLANGSTLGRAWSIPFSEAAASSDLASVYESVEYRARYDDLFGADISDVESGVFVLSVDGYVPYERTVSQENALKDPKFNKAFLSAFEKDIKSLSYEELWGRRLAVCRIDFTFPAEEYYEAGADLNPNSFGPTDYYYNDPLRYRENDRYLEFFLNASSFDNTFNFLRENGFAESLDGALMPDEGMIAVVGRPGGKIYNPYGIEAWMYYGDEENVPKAESSEYRVLEDRELIQELAVNYGYSVAADMKAEDIVPVGIYYTEDYVGRGEVYDKYDTMYPLNIFIINRNEVPGMILREILPN